MSESMDFMNTLAYIRKSEPATMVIPISTRGVGFHSQNWFSRAYCSSDVEAAHTPYSLYRVTLFQLHYRIIRAQRLKYFHYDEHFSNAVLHPGFVNVISQFNTNFDTLARLITALGNFAFEGVEYTPRLPILPKDTFPDPINVQATNLRETVVALSSKSTDQNVRKYFYDHNPLPCAIWNSLSDSDFPLLMNPDDFMTESYDEDDLRRDVDEVNKLMSHSTATKWVDNVLYDAPGDPAIFLSNRPSGLKIDEIPEDEFSKPNYAAIALKGNVSTFWSPRRLNQEQLYQGALYLAGELPNPKSYDMNYALRAPTIQVLQANLNLRNIFARGAA